MTKIKEIINEATEQLNLACIDDAEFNVMCMASELLNCSNAQLPLYYRNLADNLFTNRLNQMVKRRINHEPLQYILGNWDFLDFTVKVDKRALIPRPETEEVFLAAHKIIKKHIIPIKGDNFNFADIGTGTGVLGIAMARAFPKAIGILTDISSDALSLAEENAQKLVPNCNKRIKFKICDLINEFEPNSLDVIISNPPYIKSDDINKLMPEIRDYEPHLALESGDLGYEMPVTILKKAEETLTDGGLVIVEHGDGQQNDILKCIDAKKWRIIEGKKDLNKKERYIFGIKA